MKQLFQADYAFLRSEADLYNLTLWDQMEVYELHAKKQLNAKLDEQKFTPTNEIRYDWSRELEPARYHLRAWCYAERI